MVVEHVVGYALPCDTVGVSTYCFITFKTWSKHVASLLVSRLCPVPRPLKGSGSIYDQSA